MAKTAIQMIQEERERQKTVEGWTPEHDDTHADGELAAAAACYASPFLRIYVQEANDFGDQRYRYIWPWDKKWDKCLKHSRVKQLTIAGALIVAELERLQRAEAKEKD